MSLSSIRNAMSGLQAGPVEYTLPRQIKNVCPHLELEEVDELVVEARDTKLVRFLGPPTVIRGAEHMYSLSEHPADEGKTKLVLSWCGVNRRKESYAMTTIPDGLLNREYDYRERVADYAEVNWGNNLQWDRGVQYIHFLLCEPGRRTRHHYPVVRHETMVSLRETWINLTQSEDSYPIPQLVEQSLELISNNRFVHAEMLGDVKPLAAYICLKCGGGLGLDECHFCKARVVSKKEGRANWQYPIPMRIVNENGWNAFFENPPVNAMKAYYGDWSMKGYQSPRPTAPRERERSIVLRDEDES